MKIQRNSWHYKMLNRFDRNYSWFLREDNLKHTNSCEYISHVFGCFIYLTFMTIMIGVGCISLIGALASPFLYFFGLADVNESAASLGLSLWIIGIVIATTLIFISIREKMKKRNCNTKPGFFSQTYDRLKNRYCSKIELTSEDS